MVDEPQRYGGTIAPLIVKDMVVAGVSEFVELFAQTTIVASRSGMRNIAEE